MNNLSERLFICFAAEDRYDIAEPVAFHLKNYGVPIWYDRHTLVMGDNRKDKNLEEGAARSRYALVILSKHTADSECAMEELSIIESQHSLYKNTVFPVLYELSPRDIPNELQWIKKLIFKEVDRHSGTREVCNHIACKITSDFLSSCRHKSIQAIIDAKSLFLPAATASLLESYQGVDSANINSRIALLYSAYLTIILDKPMRLSTVLNMVAKIFERLFSETRLHLSVDYRDLWLLENSICILVNLYLAEDTEPSI